MIDFSTLQGLTIPVMTKRVKLTNLVPAMDSLTFSVGSSSGTCEMSTAHTKYNSKVLCSTGVVGYNEMYVLTSQKFQLIPDHFYYACVEVYQETKLGSVDYFWPSGSPSIFGGQATGNAGAWKKCSNVTTRTSFSAGEYPVRLDFNNGGTAGKIWYDGLMLVDLTEAFGAGNEPGTAWCDANIPYFTDTMELGWKFDNLAPAINGTTGFTTWAAGGTFSAEASTTHTKYATQSLKMSIGSDCAEILASSANAYPLDSSHVYYARVEAYQEVASGTMEIYFPIAEPHMFNTPAKEAGKWNVYSSVCGRSTFTTGTHKFRLDFNRDLDGKGGEVWCDGLMLIDLTAACGAGNEPSKEWCDANIPYFTGTTTILPLSSPIQASVTQITDASGRVLWKKETSKPVVLNVAKQTLTTYAGETSYADEQFVLLSIYPKTNGTVKVTYGGLTKTITDTSGAESPNAQRVFFGTFNGVSDSVTTPASGELTIEGAYTNFAVSSYQYGSKTNNLEFCDCITDVVDWGDITSIVDDAFYKCTTNLALTSLPNSLTSIGARAFYKCTNLALTSLPNSLTSIGTHAFYDCSNIVISTIPEGVTILNTYVFYMENNTSLMKEGEITLPATMQTINYSALAVEDTVGDPVWMFKNIIVLATTPPALIADVAIITNDNYGVETITVPKGCGEAYKAAENWSKYADIIVEAS